MSTDALFPHTGVNTFIYSKKCHTELKGHGSLHVHANFRMKVVYESRKAARLNIRHERPDCECSYTKKFCLVAVRDQQQEA